MLCMPNPPLSKKKDKQAKKKKPLKNSKNIQNQKYYIVRYSHIYIVNNQAIYILLDFPTLLMNWLTAIIVINRPYSNHLT